ncbi:MAG: uracil-DNA glycosylase [Clostridia bacterium]|nr:uracil-DNA glycosylase [Clostridia bacterium]
MKISWEQLYDEIGACSKCRLCQTRTNVVPGEGDIRADIMFIGEGPGRDEDLQGRPFVGRSGELLTRMIEAIDLQRSEVYICNIVKCRPPGNRNPEVDEAQACMNYLRAQFALVRPKIIVLLGKVACRYTLNEDISIRREHGRWYERKGVFFMPTFHPSALLRDPSQKRDAWEDFQKIRAKLNEIRAEQAAKEQ